MRQIQRRMRGELPFHYFGSQPFRVNRPQKSTHSTEIDGMIACGVLTPEVAILERQIVRSPLAPHKNKQPALATVQVHPGPAPDRFAQNCSIPNFATAVVLASVT